MGKENVHTALSLVGYESDVEAAMKFVFGSSFVCSNMETAKKVGDNTMNRQSTILYLKVCMP